MANKYLSDMPIVSSKDVIPKYTGEDTIEKLAIAVNGMREMQKNKIYIDGQQLMELELMYSLAIYLRDKNDTTTIR